jgi:hypothetical protein
MINLLLKAIDRVIDLARIDEKRMKARYKEIYKPSFEELQSVHIDYLGMFTDLEWKLRKIDRTLPGNDPSGAESPTEALEFLRARRVTFLPVRQKLMAIEDLLRNTKGIFPEVEQTFLQSIVDYFIAGGLSTSRYSTQSTTLLDQLERIIVNQVAASECIAAGENLESNVPSLSDVRKECLRAMKELGGSWHEVVERFNALRLTYTKATM